MVDKDEKNYNNTSPLLLITKVNAYFQGGDKGSDVDDIIEIINFLKSKGYNLKISSNSITDEEENALKKQIKRKFKFVDNDDVDKSDKTDKKYKYVKEIKIISHKKDGSNIQHKDITLENTSDGEEDDSGIDFIKNLIKKK
jgi:hypothetical protein